MTSETQRFEATEASANRVKMLEQKLPSRDLNALLGSRNAVNAFLRLGRKWYLFALDHETSLKTGYARLKNRNMPESHLASLIGSQMNDDCAKFESEIDTGLQQNPKHLAEKLIDEAERLQQINSEQHDTVKADTTLCREVLSGTENPADYYDCIDIVAPSDLQSDWFQVIANHDLSPADIEGIINAVENGTWQGNNVDIDLASSQTHKGVARITPDVVN